MPLLLPRLVHDDDYDDEAMNLSTMCLRTGHGHPRHPVSRRELAGLGADAGRNFLSSHPDTLAGQIPAAPLLRCTHRIPKVPAGFPGNLWQCRPGLEGGEGVVGLGQG